MGIFYNFVIVVKISHTYSSLSWELLLDKPQTMIFESFSFKHFSLHVDNCQYNKLERKQPRIVLHVKLGYWMY